MDSIKISFYDSFQAIVDMMADDIEQVDELTQRWSRCKVNVVAAMTPLFNIVNAIKSVLADFRVIKQLFFCKFRELVLRRCAHAAVQGFIVR